MVNFNFIISNYIPSYDLNFGAIYIQLNILSGENKNSTSIWADANANVNTAKVYIGTSGEGAALSVVDLGSRVLADNYLIDKIGGFNDSLDREDIEDININLSGV